MAARETPSLLPYADNSGIPHPSFMMHPQGTIQINTERIRASTAAVVAAVEMLQTRKLKPDKERIYSYLEKHFPEEVRADPGLAERLINDALAQSLIVLVNNLEVYSFRTPSKIGRMLRVTKIVAWEGEVPHSVVLEVLQVIGEVEEAAPESTEESPKGIGVSVKEILDRLHDNLRLLNYHAKIITQKVMPIAIKEGLATMLPRQFYTLTNLCRRQLGIQLLPYNCATVVVGSVATPNDHHFAGEEAEEEEEESSPGTSQVVVVKPSPVHRTPKKPKRDSNGSNGSNGSTSTNNNSKNNTADKFSDSDLSPGVKSAASSTSSSRRRPREDDDDDEGEEEGEEEEEEEEADANTDHDMGDTAEWDNGKTIKEPITNEIGESKEIVNEDSSKSPEVKDVSNVPQRVSTRKRFKKSLGPDFVDSSDQMAYYMKEPNASLKCGMCNVLLTKGKPSIMGRTKAKPGGSNDKQELEKGLIQCSSCVLKVHTACLSLKEQIGSKSQWKCAACGVCSVCSIKSKRKEFIISCTACKRGFHTCCTSVAQTSPDNTTWHCTHCLEADQKEGANASASDDLAATPKVSFTIKPIGKQITPTIITGNGTIASSKSLLPKASSSMAASSAPSKQQLKKVSQPTLNYNPKETTMLLPKPASSETPASNSLLMPVTIYSHCGMTASYGTRPPKVMTSSEMEKFNKKYDKKFNRKNRSEILLFRNAERLQNHSESSPTMNGSSEPEAKQPPAQKSVKVKKNGSKPKQQSLIKPVDKPAGTLDNDEIKEDEANETNHASAPVNDSPSDSTLPPLPSPSLPPSLPTSPSLPLSPPIASSQPATAPETRKRPARSGPNIKLLFGENSCSEMKHNFMAWVSCEFKHLVKFDPKPFNGLSTNVLKWSCQDVNLFLNSIGFVSCAQFALDNQVDGMSLLLLSRQDIISRFPIKLGPALKLHAFLTRIRNEFELY